MLEVNYTLAIQVINFLVLLFLLNIIIYRPIRGILARRKKEMDSASDMAEDWRTRADKFFEELETNISVTRAEGLKERENLRNMGVADEGSMLQDANSAAEDKLIKIKEEIQDRLAVARQSLQAELEGFSRDLAEKILGRGI